MAQNNIFSPDLLQCKNKFKGKAITEKEKDIIMNVYCYFRRENPTSAKEDIIIQTSAATGISRNTIYKIKSARKCPTSSNNDDQETSNKAKVCRPNRRRYDTFVECAIRQKIHREFFFLNKPPTIRKLHAAVRDDPSLPNLSLSTIYR